MRWKIKQPSEDHVASIKKEFNTSEIIAKVLANRGIESLKSSHNFFNPSNDQLHDPFMMKNMDIAVDRISKNIQNQKPILIFGDYDVDGASSTALLAKYFLSIKQKMIILMSHPC